MRLLWAGAALLLAVVACEDKRTTKTIRTVTAPPPSLAPLPSASAPRTYRDPAASVALVCARLLECRGEDASALGKTRCEQNFLEQAKDEETKDSLAAAFDAIAQKCKATACDKYFDCYTDALQSQMGSGPPPKVDPQTRGRFVAAYCVLATRSHGIPDLNAVDAPPEVQELRTLTAEIDQRAIPDLMKEALVACAGIMQAMQPSVVDAGAKGGRGGKGR